MKKLTVSDETIRRADQCKYAYSCLTTQKCGEHELCEVHHAVAKGATFLKQDVIGDCPYSFDYGGSATCSCPVRFEIFIRYKL